MKQFKENRRINTNMLPKKYFRPFGNGSHACRFCDRHNGLIRRYDLFICRQCFRANANKIGFYR